MSLLRRLSVTGWMGLIIVGATVLAALVSVVWTPYDPLLGATSH